MLYRLATGSRAAALFLLLLPLFASFVATPLVGIYGVVAAVVDVRAPGTSVRLGIGVVIDLPCLAINALLLGWLFFAEFTWH